LPSTTPVTRRSKPKPRGRTGPTTKEGKERAKLNALKHGLATELGIIPGHEDPDEWREFRDGIIESLTPVGRLEETLAELVARGLWRHDRALRNEAYTTMKRIERAGEDVAFAAQRRAILSDDVVDEEAVLQDALEEHLRRVIPAKDDLELGMRYESHVQRQWKTALHELQVLQARRLGERPNVMRFDVTHTAA
jgi:hypothetical protein